MKGRDLKMSKTKFYTCDIFDFDDCGVGKKMFDSCRKKL